MVKRIGVPTLLGLLMVLSTISGCLGGDLFEPEDKKGIPGGLTLACLSSAKYTSMVIEIDYEPGYMPEQSSINLLKTRLQEVCDKPNGIEVELTKPTLVTLVHGLQTMLERKRGNTNQTNPKQVLLYIGRLCSPHLSIVMKMFLELQ